MGRHVVSLSSLGGLGALKTKKGQGVNLLALGQAKITRVTLIEWAEEHQQWFIKWVKGEHKGKLWDCSTFSKAEVSTDPWPVSLSSMSMGGVVYFQEYEDAVSAEIAVVQALQTSGKSKEVFSS